MKRLLVSMLVLGFAASLTALAEGPAVESKPAAIKVAADKPVALKAIPAGELVLTGKLMQKETVKADAIVEVKKEGATEVVKEKGKETITTQYVLVTADGDIVLPEPKAKAGGETILLEKFVGKDVKVVVKGSEKKEGDKKVIKVKSIVSVEEVVPVVAK